MTILFSIIQVLNTGPVSEIGQMGNFLTTKRRPPVSTVKSEFPGYNGKREITQLQRGQSWKRYMLHSSHVVRGARGGRYCGWHRKFIAA